LAQRRRSQDARSDRAGPARGARKACYYPCPHAPPLCAFEAVAVALTPEELQLAYRLESIFMPYAGGLRAAALASKGRFVHYTSATAALEIIKTKRLWMRNTTCMADYREVQHGFDTLNRFFNDEAAKSAFLAALDQCADGLAAEAIALFNQWWSDVQLQTYISSISEHDDSEDFHGRLSMWRAFGRSGPRVALVFTIPLDSGVAAPLNILFSPVAYFDDARLNAEMYRVIAQIRGNREFLRTLERSRLIAMAFTMLVSGVVCLKHEGFKEEREWRVIYAPKRNPSSLVTSSVEVVDGVPQVVYKLPLDASASPDLAAIDIARLFNRVIIGPSPYPWVMYEAFVTALAEAGVEKAADRVWTSGIPIRA
jgi:hypothetical protein